MSTNSNRDRPKNQKRQLVTCHCWYTPIRHKTDKFKRIYRPSCPVHKKWDPIFPAGYEADFPPQPIEQ